MEIKFTTNGGRNMKKKVLAILLTVTVLSIVGNTVCAADFTSGTENTTELSGSIADDEDISENIIDENTTLEVNKEPETTEEPENIELQEKSDGTLEFASEEIINEEDTVPEFNDGQEDTLTDSADTPSASAKYPSMKKVETDKYAVTVKNATESTYAKFIPGKTGKYVFRRTVTFKNQYTHKNETCTVQIYTVYDSKFQQMNKQTDLAGYGCYELKKGKTYYIECGSGLKVILDGELLTDIASIDLAELPKTTVLYTPIDFNESAWRSGSSYDIVDRWKGKLKITYSNGKTETISTDAVNKYGSSVRHYLIYKGKKSSPVAGKYNVYFSIDGSKTTAVLKNVSVKKLSSMPILKGSGTKTFETAGNQAYVGFKTGKSTKYQISLIFPNYDPGEWPLPIMQEKNGELKRVNSVQNGKTCILKANTVYYISVSLFSNGPTNPTVTLKLTAKN